MKMGLFPQGIWTLFHKNFERCFPMLGVENTNTVMRDAKRRYGDIIKSIQPFDENDALEMNIISAAMLAAVALIQSKKLFRSAPKDLQAAGVWLLALFRQIFDHAVPVEGV